MKNLFCALGIVGLTAISSVHAASFDEQAQGDLSNDRLAPTPWVLDLGANPLRGSMGLGDLDYLAVTVPSGRALTALRVGEGLVLGGVRAFLAVQAGNQMTVPADTDSANALLGAMHYQDAAVGTDLLPDLGNGHLGAIGFTGALPAGQYTFWIQDTSFEPGLRYSFNLEVSAVPEPHIAAMLLAGLGLLGTMARRRAPGTST